MNERAESQGAYSKKFNIMLEIIEHPDGGGWTGTKMERATDGEVQPSYFSSLKDGHIRIPRADKLEAIGRAMGFSPGLWFKSCNWWEGARENWEKGVGLGAVLEEERRQADEGRLSGLLNRLFETEVDEETGDLLTNERVARKSGGALTEEDVEAMRAGRLTNPTWVQVLALCSVFDVDASYWSGREVSSWRPSPEVLKATEGMDSYFIFRNSLKLSGRDRSMLKMLAEHLRREQEEDGPKHRG